MRSGADQQADRTQLSTSRPSSHTQNRGPNSRGRCGTLLSSRRAPSTRHGTVSRWSRWVSAIVGLLVSERVAAAGGGGDSRRPSAAAAAAAVVEHLGIG